MAPYGPIVLIRPDVTVVLRNIFTSHLAVEHIAKRRIIANRSQQAESVRRMNVGQLSIRYVFRGAVGLKHKSISQVTNQNGNLGKGD